ncbi:hypothetical protein LJK88_24435 [Paenibacillus sp. P26]|nr:hypothetical protein LJK88_24435 [Paenibacillus sp. P26]
MDSPELKQKLLPIAFNQQQVVEAAAVIAVLGDMESIRNIEKIYGQAVEAGYMPEETAKSFVARYKGMFETMPREDIHRIVYTDGGLVSMQLMLVARARGYDTVPMGVRSVQICGSLRDSGAILPCYADRHWQSRQARTSDDPVAYRGCRFLQRNAQRVK